MDQNVVWVNGFRAMSTATAGDGNDVSIETTVRQEVFCAG